MATYNWAYRPNTPNKYGIDIAESDNDVKPDNAVYLALFGNDDTGNGSRIYPFRTIVKATEALGVNNDGNKYLVFSSGVWREGVYSAFSDFNTVGGVCWIGDGDVTLDFSYFIERQIYPYGFLNFFWNIKFKGANQYFCSGNAGNLFIQAYDCTFNGMTPNGNENGNSGGVQRIFKNCIFKNLDIPFALMVSNHENCTFINCKRINSDTYNLGYIITSCIFVNCNIVLNNPMIYHYRELRHCIFFNCCWRITPDANIYEPIPTTVYPIIPDGYENFSDIEEVREAISSRLSTSFPPFLNNCVFVDPKFNNPEVEDYSLAFDSPAKNLSYFGTYVGAKSIGYPIKAKADENDGDFDFSTAVNVSITDNSIMLTNPELDASIETRVVPNLSGRELAEAPIFGFNADKNGQYIDSLADLSETTVSAGTSLKDLTPYLVEIASIILDDDIYQPGERFTTKDVLHFSSDGGGVCREILEAPQRHTIMARFSNGGAPKNVGDALVVGYWYYPIAGTIIYNGIGYNEKAFKAVDTNSFTTSDGGVLIEAFSDEKYQHYEPGIAFSSNNVGNVRTGEVLRGNGDPDYVRGAGFEFPINARFIQLKYIIRVKNLKP